MQNSVHQPFAEFRIALQTIQRRLRDSNPRYTLEVYTLSRRAPSTTRTSLQLRTAKIQFSLTLLMCRATQGPELFISKILTIAKHLTPHPPRHYQSRYKRLFILVNDQLKNYSLGYSHVSKWVS